MIWIIQNLNIALQSNQTTMNFLKTKVFPNDETSVTWGKALMYLGIILAGGTALTLVIMQVFKSFN